MKCVFGNHQTLTSLAVQDLFQLSHSVMSSHMSTEEDYLIWMKSYQELRKNTQYVFLYQDYQLKGFLAYKIDDKYLTIEDVIISLKLQGDGKTLGYLFDQFFKDIHNKIIDKIFAYTNKKISGCKLC